MGWPPKAGEMLAGAEKATNVREKLAGYSLDAAHEEGGPKARAFERILGITIADVEYLEAIVREGIGVTPIESVRHNPPYGYNCVVEFSLAGRGAKSGRAVRLRTVWRVAAPDSAPHLTTAYLRP